MIFSRVFNVFKILKTKGHYFSFTFDLAEKKAMFDKMYK